MPVADAAEGMVIRMTKEELLKFVYQAFIASLRDANMLIGHQGELSLTVFQNAQIAAYNQGVIRMHRELLKGIEEVADRDDG